MLGDNKLKKINDPRVIGQILLSAKERQEQILVWRFVGDKKLMAPVRLDLILPLRRELVLSPLPGSEEVFQHVLGSSETLNFYLPFSGQLFQSHLKHQDENAAHAVFPDFIAQIERRKWLRMPGMGSLRVQFNKPIIGKKLTHHFFSRELFDLSAGGASFLVSRAEAKFFTAGESFKGLELLIQGQKTILTVAVIRVQEIAARDAHGYKAWKVGLRFENADKNTQEELAKFVFTHLGAKALAI